jgi:chromate transporter
VANENRTSLRELAIFFASLGTTAFGGPAAHTAMMLREVVERRQWLTREEFLDLASATNLIPGPNSTELAIHIGQRRAGWRGLLVAGACFILPAALIVTACAWAYVRYGTLPAATGAMRGVKPVIIAIVLLALRDLAKTALKDPATIAAFLVALALALLGWNELLVLSIAALTGAVRFAGVGRAVAPFGLWPLFWFFAKTGSVLYGSGYVLLAFLRADLVGRWHWLTEAQLLDAIAVGQFTPGPVFTTATFIGYLLGGVPGAIVATIGIFAPAFFFVAISGPLVPRLRSSTWARPALNGVNAGSLALMGAVSYHLGRGVLVDVPSIALLAVAGSVLLRFRLNSAWLVLAGAVVGTILYR